MEYEHKFYHLVPDLPEAVAQIWDDCGTTIESPNCTAGEKELEFFLEEFIKCIAMDIQIIVPGANVYKYLEELDYIKKDLTCSTKTQTI